MSAQQSVLEEMRNQALEIFQAALRAAEPADAILRHVKMGGGLVKAGRLSSSHMAGFPTMAPPRPPDQNSMMIPATWAKDRFEDTLA